MRTTLVALALLGLVGCSGQEAAPVENGPGSTVTLYCYKTLADPGCYLFPEPRHGNTLLGIVDVPWTPEIALIASPNADGE